MGAAQGVSPARVATRQVVGDPRIDADVRRWIGGHPRDLWREPRGDMGFIPDSAFTMQGMVPSSVVRPPPSRRPPSLSPPETTSRGVAGLLSEGPGQ